MKRGLFKLGRHFKIDSTTAVSQFAVTIDVDAWVKDTDPEWTFEFDRPPIENRSFAIQQQGTAIVVTKLHQGVKEQFAQVAFLQDLRHELTVRLEESILKGMTVKVNKLGLKAHPRTLLADKRIAPARKQFKIQGPGRGKVHIDLWCGPGKAAQRSQARQEAGWYVFCNGRMLLEADKTAATGWGEGEDESVPAFHPQYNDFRGYAYLEADDAGDLPWNTTKTALDTEHPVYRRVRQEMIAVARPVIMFFNSIRQEREGRRRADNDTAGPLETLLQNAKNKPLDKLSPRVSFVTPRLPQAKLRRGGVAMLTCPAFFGPA